MAMYIILDETNVKQSCIMIKFSHTLTLFSFKKKSVCKHVLDQK